MKSVDSLCRKSRGAMLVVTFVMAVHSQAAPPLAIGLPAPFDSSEKKGWKGTLNVEGQMILKDGKPFFPIGLVAAQSDAQLAEAKAMGCTAVHFEIGWNVQQQPGALPVSDYDPCLQDIRRAASWGLAVVPLLSAHYVPNWFWVQHPPDQCAPRGSDGAPTGGFTPCSLHFQPMRDQLAFFWRGAASALGPEPNVLNFSMWNEPGYGGSWDRGDQFADYSTAGLSDYRTFLQAKYQTIDAFNAKMGSKYTSWEDMEPPKNPDERSRQEWLEWMEYGQQFVAHFFDSERSTLKEAYPPIRLALKKQTTPWDNAAASSGVNWYLMGQSEDITGLDIYGSSPFSIRSILDGAASLGGDKPVVIFEINSMPPGAAARTPDVIRTQLWSALAGGARGMFIYALIDDPDHGLLNDKAASPEARAEYTRVITNIAHHQRELASPRARAEIGVLYSTKSALQFPRDTFPHAALGAFDLFCNSDYQVDFIPEEKCTAGELGKYKVVVAPSDTILTAGELHEVDNYLASGGHLIAFAGAFARDEKFQPQPPPAFLGLTKRGAALGDRSNQKISTVAVELQKYLEDEITLTGCELVGASAETGPLVQGAVVRTDQTGKILAQNSDSFPAVVQNGPVVYCAFNSDYNENLRALLEGVLREELGLRQSVRLVNPSTLTVDSSTILGLRRDYTDSNKEYLLAINTAYRPKTLVCESSEGWKITRELLHSSSPSLTSIQMAPREVYLFDLEKSK